MIAAALLAAGALAARAHATPACEALERHGRIRRAAQAVARPWPEVKAAFLGALEGEKGNAAAARAAEFWRRSGLGLAEAPMADAIDIPAGSELDLREGVIVLDSRDLAPLWAAWGTRRGARALRETVDRLSPVIVHELAHARLREGLGPLPPFSEEELLADAEETLYLWARLRADPDALGLRAFDQRVEPGRRPRRGWWTRALPRDDADLEWAIEEASRGVEDGWVAERWRLVRGMGGGYDAFREVLDRGGVLDDLSVFSLTDAQRRRAAADLRRLRAEHERCLAAGTEGPEDRRDLEGWVRQLSGQELAIEDASRLRRVAGRYRAAMDAQRRDLAALGGAPAR